MHLSHPHLNAWTFAAAAAAAIIAFALPKPAHAQSSGIYTTTTNSTSTSSTNSAGVTTTTTNSTSNTPSAAYGADRWRNARNSGGDRSWRDRAARDEDADPNNTSDLEARYPYDNTNGRNRSDVDAARSGFDDPRNPWDGRYVNDNPANSGIGEVRGSNAAVNAQMGNETSRNLGNSRYRPGSYNTRRAGN